MFQRLQRFSSAATTPHTTPHTTLTKLVSMRNVFALAALSIAALNAQPISVGILAGAPFTDVVNATTTNNVSFLPTSTNFTIGPALQINLPLSLRFEVDALYRPYSFSVNPANGGAFPQANVSAGQWR